MPSASYSPTITGQDYTPGGSGNAYQVLSAWDVGGGRPVLVVFGDGDFTAAGADAVPAELTSANGIPYYLHAAGWSVIWVSWTPTDAGVTGGGTFKAVDDGSAYLETDAQKAVQWVRQNATARGYGSTVLAMGIGAGAQGAFWTAFQPDRADAVAPIVQDRQSSRVSGVVASDAVTYWQALDQTIAATHFAASGDLSGVATATQDAASAADYAVGSGLNAAVPVFGVYTGASSAQSTSTPFPTDFSVSGADGWHGAALLGALQGESVGSSFHAHRSEVLQRGDNALITADRAVAAGFEWALREGLDLSAEEQVMRATQRLLRSIKHANGFRTDVVSVHRWDDDDLLDYPSIILTAQDADYDPAQSFHGKSQNTIRVGLALRMSGFANAIRRTSNFIADVRQAIEVDEQLADSVFGQTLACKMRILRSQRFQDAYDDGSEVAGALCVLQIEWRDLSKNPYRITT